VWAINDRQRLVLNRLLDGFAGKLTTSKYAKTRQVLAGTRPSVTFCLWWIAVFWFAIRKGGGSTSYELAPRL